MALRIIILFLLGIVVAITIRVLLFSTFIIPSISMSPTLIPGDYIIVNKLIPGARVIKNITNPKFVDGNISRLFGYRSIKKNDVIVFNPLLSSKHGLKMDINKYYIKRCIGIPGDMVYINKGFYQVNNLNNIIGNYANQLELFHLSETELKAMKIYSCFPKTSWNIKNFGPLYIPKAAKRILIDTINIKYYKNLIEYETGDTIEVIHQEVLLNKKPLKSYKFQENYYFMAGDFVLDSKDSRYWGLLPEIYIIGKVELVLSSTNTETGEYRYNRFLKVVK